ncbi:xylulokinase [Vibrio panuliri]|uniref:Xylulose kinase n=1 Tax=Vibrio panuliri TaxID=1381081 RepID=A0A1Q9HJY0_9VIBR|nr:xylulokinase [Vibrio panuliri]OLQ90590.1 xylulokinase [Vibrio panuliri]
MGKYIGIDVGTSSVKAVLIEHGKVLCTESRTYSTHSPCEGWFEQYPRDWWETTADAIRSIASNHYGQIDAIGLTGQMHTAVMINSLGEPIYPAILWCDGRSAEQSNYINQHVGEQAVIEHTGNVSMAGFTASKILWLKEHHAKKAKLIHKVMMPKDYIAYRLTGVVATDYSDASGTMLFNVREKRWSAHMLDKLELDQSLLPDVYPSDTVIGSVSSSVVKQLSLGCQPKVVIGGGDNAMGAVACGVVSEGMATASIGTSGVIFAPKADYPNPGDGFQHTFCDATGNYHQMGVMLSAAKSYQWLKNIVGLSYEQLNTELKNANPVTTPLFYPYLSGERNPFYSPNARGAFASLDAATDVGDLARSVIEGVSFSMKNLWQMMGSPQRVRLTGSPITRSICPEIFATTLNQSIEVMPETCSPALGAAITAAVGAGEFATFKEATDHCVPKGRMIAPITKDIELLQARSEKFNTKLQHIKATFD